MQLKELLQKIGSAHDSLKQQQPDEKKEELCLSFITFSISGKIYAIDINNANEIIKIDKISLVPNAPQYISGVTNLRGDIIPILDLKEKFIYIQNSGGSSEKTGTKSGPRKSIKGKIAIVVKSQETSFGLLIDEILKTVSVPVSKISLNPVLINTLGSEYISGLVKRGENDQELLMILNIDRLAEG